MISKLFKSFLPCFAFLCAACSEQAAFTEPADTDASFQISDRISNLNIRAFAEDLYGHIWIGTNRGLNRYTGLEFYQYFQGEDETTINNSAINSFLFDSEGRMWIATDSGVCRYNGDNSFTRIPVNTTMVATNRLVQLESGTILVHTSFGEWLKFEEDSDAFFLISSKDPVLEMVPSPVPAPDISYLADRLPFTPTVSFKDSHNNMWIGSEGHGFRLISGQQKVFNRNSPLCESLKDVNVISLAADSQDNLWIAAMENRLFYAAKGEVALPVALPGDVTGLQVLAIDPFSGDLWIGAGTDLLRCKDARPLHVLERVRQEAFVRSLTSDGNGRVFAGLSNGTVAVYDYHSHAHHIVKLASSRSIYDLLAMRNGSVWITQFREGISILDPESDTVELLDYREDVGEVFHLLSIFEDRQGNILFPTRDYGLLRYDSKTGTFALKRGFSCSRLAAVGQTAGGDIWISSAHGLNLCEDTKTVPFYEQSGIGGDQFNRRAVCTLADGTVVFGGTHGITTCHDTDIQDGVPFPLLFEQLQVNGAPAPEGAWEGDLYGGPQVRLKYNQNTLTISYASLDYPHAETSWYTYKLEGFDKMVYTAGNERVAHYSNLPPGKYRFHVWQDSAFNQDPVEAILPITILPAPWESWWACSLYGLALAGLVVLGLWFARREIRMKLAIEQSVREKEHEQYINRMNMNFFANMAHEFRTPLTMIAGPVSQLQESDGVSEENKRILSIVRLSVERMMKLASHLLDFNKLDADSLVLENKPGVDIADRLRKSVDLFQINARRFGLQLETEGLGCSCKITVDPDQFDSIVENLLSNAFKYTDRKSGEGWVAVRLIPGEEKIKVHVENNGNPISEEALEKLFDRYYQIREHTDNQRAPGTGIGLYYAKALAEKMGGSLTAANLEGKVCFTLTLPSGGTELSPAVIRQDVPEDPEELSEEDTVAEAGKRTILVVDDDADLANYLSMILSPNYRVICAYDADQALSIAGSKDMPDLVLSDIVMPGTDGISLCKSLKSNLVTCHIPVILVTAKVGVDNEVEGLESGADAYVAKPFDPSYILALTGSILRNRDLLRGELASTTDIVEVNASTLGMQDREFLNTLYLIMESEIANPDFDIQGVAERMHVSRSKLFYKVRNLTGMSPLQLFRTYRLNVAANLLKSGKYNVSEVADKVGFVSLSYFSKSFKQQFGILPKDAARK